MSNDEFDNLQPQSYLNVDQLIKLYDSYNKRSLEPTTKEKLIINPKLAYEITDQLLHDSIPYELIKRYRDVYGEISKVSKVNPVSNLNWDFLYFVNSDYFRPAALAFERSERAVIGSKIKASYTQHIPGTKSYEKFWEQEFTRIVSGYEPIIDGKPCGLRISGEFYFYLNYCRIEKVTRDNSGKTIVRSSFPDFLAMDYYYFKELESRENPSIYGYDDSYKRSIALVKSRRKGFSYKAAAGCVWIAAFNKKARVGIASEPNTSDATDAVKCARKCLPIIDHLTLYTPFGRKNPGDPKINGGWIHSKAKNTDKYFSFTFGLENTKTRGQRGRMSSIFTMSLSKDDAASGEGLNRLYFEESGKISNLDKAWIFARESMKAGSLFRGVAVLYGTGGEMKSSSGADGSSKAFSTLFNNPVAAELAAYDNIYEYKNSNEKCGYFVADMWSNFGAYIKIDGKIYESLDRMGNAFFWVAELALNKERYDKMPPKGKQKDYNDFLTQRCKTPSEAFLVTSTNIFNSADIIARINKIKMEKGGFSKYRTPGELYTTTNNNVQFKPNNLLEPVTNTNQSSSNREGCLLVYENPIKINGSIPEGAYIIAVDPIAMNNSGGNSLNAVIVMKTPRYSDVMGPEKIVATYFGRSSVRPLDYLHRLLLNLSKYYNAQISHENDRDGGILSFFTHKNELHRLMPSPRLVTKKYLPGSKTLLREFGHSMGNERLKSVGEGYLNEWLDFRHPSRKLVNESTGNIEEKEGLRNLDMIYDELILDELVNYNRNGNFDSTMALMGAMVQLSDKFNTQGDVFVDNDYYNEIDRQMVSYIKDKVGDYF
jgi:hypothetical protein